MANPDDAERELRRGLLAAAQRFAAGANEEEPTEGEPELADLLAAFAATGDGTSEGP